MVDTPAHDRLVSAVSQLIEAARKSSTPIIHSLLDFNKSPPPVSKLTSAWNATYAPMVASNPEAIKEFKAFRATGTFSKEITTHKSPGCISNLKSEELKNFLRQQGVKSVIICGLTTSGAVMSTAVEAVDLGFVTTVVKDACWDFNLQSHNAILDELLPMTCYTVGLSEALDLLPSIEE